MTKVDDLSKRDLVVISLFKGEVRYDQKEPLYSGQPFEILAISLPFVCVKDGKGYTGAFDTREWELQKVSREYFNSYYRNELEARKRKLGKGKPKNGDCPRCGNRLVKRYSASRDRDQWEVACNNCEYHFPIKTK